MAIFSIFTARRIASAVYDVVLCPSVCHTPVLYHKHLRVGPGQSPPLILSLPHLLLYLLVSFTFYFFTRFIYFHAFPSLPILPE